MSLMVPMQIAVLIAALALPQDAHLELTRREGGEPGGESTLTVRGGLVVGTAKDEETSLEARIERDAIGAVQRFSRTVRRRRDGRLIESLTLEPGPRSLLTT